MIRLEIEKIQYDVNRETTKISTLSSGKIDKYLTVEEILPSDKVGFTDSPLGNAIEK